MTDEYDINRTDPHTRQEVAGAVLEIATTQAPSAYDRYYKARDKLVAESKLKSPDPELPSKAEVDAEIADALRENVKLGPASDSLTPIKGGFAEKMRLLCAKPFAPPDAAAWNSISELEQELVAVRRDKDLKAKELEQQRLECEQLRVKLGQVRSVLEAP